VCAGALVKWGVKVSEVISCKAVIKLKIFETFLCLTLHYLNYSDFYIVSTVWCTYLFVHKISTTKNLFNKQSSLQIILKLILNDVVFLRILCSSVYSKRSHFSVTSFVRKRFEISNYIFSFPRASKAVCLLSTRL